MKTIKIQSVDGAGRFNLRTITLGAKCGSRAYSEMFYGVTDKGRNIFVLVFDDQPGFVGVKTNDGQHPSEAACKGWMNQYEIIESTN